MKRKIRQIDDLAESYVNSCVEIKDKIGLTDIDGIASIVKTWQNAVEEARVSSSNTATFYLNSGEVLSFQVHEAYLKPDSSLRGLVKDLEAAYKQCPIHPDDYRHSVLVLKVTSSSSSLSPLKKGKGHEDGSIFR